MNGWRTTACVFMGLTVGLLARELMRDKASADSPQAESIRQNESLKAQVQQLTAELAASRDARRRPREGPERPAGEIPENSRSPYQVPSTAPSGPAVVTATAVSAEERMTAARARLRVARDELQTAMAAHNGEKALDLLKQFAKIALDLPEARDDAMKLAVDINKDVNGAGELHLSQFVYYGGLGDPAVRDLMLWSMEHQGASPPEFRVLSAWSIPWAMKPEETIAKYEAALVTESDRGVQGAIVWNLSLMNDPKAEAALARIFGDSARDVALRGDAAMALATSKDPVVQRAIETAAQSDPEPKVQTAARLSLIVRDPPASGCLVTQTSPNGDAEAAGIRAGDVIVSYNGRAVANVEELAKERDSVQGSGAESVALLVVRDGREQTVQVKPGRLGLPNLRPVKKK